MNKKRVLSLLVSSAFAFNLCFANVAGAASLPSKSSYPYGQKSLSSNQSSDDSMIMTEWQNWKSSRVTSSGAGGFKRVQCSGNQDYATVSEGMGYGMLLAVYMDEQDLFNDFYRYVKLHIDNGSGLMCWRVDANGNVNTKIGDNGAATDGDEDIAVALVFASKKWGSSGAINYEQEAKTYINNLYNTCIEPGSYVVKPGNWGGSSCLNPCYFVPAWYRIFAQFTGNSNWEKVADKCYQILDAIGNNNSGTGLVPDWCTANGARTDASVWNGNTKYEYSYDATRTPWRIALDYSWYGTAKSKDYCDKVAKFFSGVGAANIMDGYSLTGQKSGSNHSITFIATNATSAMTGSDIAFGKSAFNETVKTKDVAPYDYYGNTLRMLTLLYMSGNFPNLYSNNGGSGGTKLGDVNKDGSINVVDATMLKSVIVKKKSESILDREAADINKDGSINSLDYLLLKKMIQEAVR